MGLQQVESVETMPDGPRMGVPRGRWWRTAFQFVLVLSILTAFAALYYARGVTGGLGRRASDSAQIARNVSSGNGFVTNFIRPFNVSFLEVGQASFPEMNSAPLHPYAIALQFRLRAAADPCVVQTSLAFFILTIVATALLGRILFNMRAGLLGAAIFSLSAPVLRIGVSGEEWPMAALWFTLLLCAIAWHHKVSAARRVAACIASAFLSAVLIGLLYATNYSLVLLAIPVVVYFGVTGRSKAVSAATFLVVACLLISPLAYRNYTLTHEPLLGISAWDLMSNTTNYPGDTLYRSIRPDESRVGALLLFPIEHFNSVSKKLVQGATGLLSSMTSMLGLLGLPFAAVSALYRFKSPQANAIRGLAYGCGAVFLTAFAALGLPNGCVVILCPLVAVTGAAYLLLLMEARKLHPVFVRFIVAGVVLVTAASALSQIAWPGEDPDRDLSTRLVWTLSQLRTSSAFYTDQPWTVSWRSLNLAVWLPIKDSDVVGMSAMGLPMNVMIMTPECRGYAEDDLWRALYTTPWWLDYMTGADAAAMKLIRSAGLNESLAPHAKQYARRERRQFTVSSESLGDVKRLQTDPLLPDDILIVHRTDAYAQ